VLTEAEFQGLSVSDRRRIFGQKGKLAIVLTDCEAGRSVAFDKPGLESLTGRIDADIEVQGGRLPI
jgi:hypothetical protein